jgi:hypothetical protein
MVKTDAQYKADERARKRNDGLKRIEVWLHPEDWVIVKRLIERLKKRRGS